MSDQLKTSSTGTKPVTFWFTGFNHSLGGRDTLIDIQNSIAGQLRDLGFDCGRDPGMEFGRGHVVAGLDGKGARFVNIIFEGFHPGIIEEVKRTRKDGGAKFVCVMTEQPGKRGFNDVPDQDMILRQKFFKDAAPLMDAIWCLVPGSEVWAKRLNRWSVHMETGYSTMRHKLLSDFVRAEPAYDVAFYGGMTQRRWNILQALKGRGFSVITPPDVPQVDTKKLIGGHILPGAVKTADMYADIEHRNRVVSLARCVVELKPNPKREYPSSTRLNVGLHVGRACVVEKHPIDTAWKQVVDFADSYEDFFDKVAAVVADPVNAYARQLAAFQRILSADNCVGKAMKDTQLIERAFL
jgi:hypothetical protein